MAESVGSLRVDVAANVAQIRDDMGKVKAAISSGVVGIRSDLGKFNASTAASAAAMTTLRAGMAAAAAFMAGSLSRQTIEAAAEIGNLAARLGLSTDAMQMWSYAGKTVGASTQDVVKIFERLNEKLGEVTSDVTPTQLAIQKLGLTLAQVKALSPDEQLKLIADRLSKIANPAQRAAVATELLGDKANDMLAVFAKGRAGLDAITKEMQDFGLILSNETIKKAQQANREFQIIETLTGNAGKELAAQLLPALRSFRELLTDPDFQAAMKRLGAGLGMLGDVFGWTFDKIRQAIRVPAMLEAAGRLGDLTQATAKAKEDLDRALAAGSNIDEAAARYENLAKRLADAQKEYNESLTLPAPKTPETPEPNKGMAGVLDTKKAEEVAKAAKQLSFEFQKLSGDYNKLAAGFPELAFGLGIFDEKARRAYTSTGQLSGNLQMLESMQRSVNAAKLNEDYASPLQKYNVELQKLNTLNTTGLVTQEAYNAKLRELREAYAGALISGIEIQTPQARYQEQLTRLNQLLQQGIIGQKEYNKQVLNAQDAYATASNAAVSYKQIGEGVGKATETALEGMLISGKSWSEAMQGFIKDVIAELVRLLIIKRIAGLLTGGASEGLGAAAGIVGSMFADGGVVDTSSPAPTKGAPASIQGGSRVRAFADGGVIDGTSGATEGTSSLAGGRVTAFADGGVLEGGRIRAFAAGGIVSTPTLFPMASGMGLMGEAGPEAIIPLERGPNGALGVRSHGGGGSASTFNIDARGADAGVYDRILAALAAAQASNADPAGAMMASRKRFPTRFAGGR